MSGTNGDQRSAKLGLTGEEYEALQEQMKKPDYVPTMDALVRLEATVEEMGRIAHTHQVQATNISTTLAVVTLMICNGIPIPASKERGGFLVPKKLVRALDPKGHLEINERKEVIEIRYAVPQKIIQLTNRMPNGK